MLEALIPYITAPEKTLIDHVPLIGPLKLQLFGPLVATGVILGWRQALKYAKAKDIDEFLFRDYMFWVLVFAFVISHWVSVIFYFPDQVKENPWVLLAIWNGLSSVGGFFGAGVGVWWFCRKHKQPMQVFVDATFYGLILGWCFGRLGCSIVHDHPGRIVDESFFLAVGPWPDGTYRYDLGLYEFIFTVCLSIYVFFFSKAFTRKPGWLLGLAITLYMPFRFWLDFLRADTPARAVINEPDIRYLGLTTAQYFTIAFFIFGIYLMMRKPKPSDFDYDKNSDRIKREAAEEEEDDDADEEEDDDDRVAAKSGDSAPDDGGDDDPGDDDPGDDDPGEGDRPSA